MLHSVYFSTLPVFSSSYWSKVGFVFKSATKFLFSYYLNPSSSCMFTAFSARSSSLKILIFADVFYSMEGLYIFFGLIIYVFELIPLFDLKWKVKPKCYLNIKTKSLEEWKYFTTEIDDIICLKFDDFHNKTCMFVWYSPLFKNIFLI